MDSVSHDRNPNTKTHLIHFLNSKRRYYTTNKIHVM